mgnify:CR=1 FL=1
MCSSDLLAYQRRGAESEVSLDLPARWKKTDITWRTSLRGLVPASPVAGRNLTADEKKALGLSDKALAFRQRDAVSQAAADAGDPRTERVVDRLVVQHLRQGLRRARGRQCPAVGATVEGVGVARGVVELVGGVEPGAGDVESGDVGAGDGSRAGLEGVVVVRAALDDDAAGAGSPHPRDGIPARTSAVSIPRTPSLD